jgi:hypothetical protein
MPPTTPAGRLRALTNLRQNRMRIRSTAFTAIAAEVIETKRREVEAVLQGESGGWLRPSDAITVGLLARILVRLEAIDRTEAVDRWLRGQTSTSKPSMRIPAFIQIYLKLLERAHRLAESLGLSPMSRNRPRDRGQHRVRPRRAPRRTSAGEREPAARGRITSRDRRPPPAAIRAGGGVMHGSTSAVASTPATRTRGPGGHQHRPVHRVTPRARPC